MQIRVGLHSQAVVVRAIDSSLRLDYMAMGLRVKAHRPRCRGSGILASFSIAFGSWMLPGT